MAWTSPKVFVSGAVLPASDMNTYVSDNDAALRAGGIAATSQAAGDILVATSASQLARDAALSFDTSIDELKSGRFRAVDSAPATPNVSTVYQDSLVRAWAAVDGAGATLTADVNVASVTDNGTGDTTVTFATALPSANYCAIATALSGTTPSHTCIRTKATGSVRVLTFGTNFGSAADLAFSVACIGG